MVAASGHILVQTIIKLGDVSLSHTDRKRSKKGTYQPSEGEKEWGRICTLTANSCSLFLPTIAEQMSKGLLPALSLGSCYMHESGMNTDRPGDANSTFAYRHHTHKRKKRSLASEDSPGARPVLALGHPVCAAQVTTATPPSYAFPSLPFLSNSSPPTIFLPLSLPHLLCSSSPSRLLHRHSHLPWLAPFLLQAAIFGSLCSSYPSATCASSRLLGWSTAWVPMPPPEDSGPQILQPGAFPLALPAQCGCLHLELCRSPLHRVSRRRPGQRTGEPLLLPPPPSPAELPALGHHTARSAQRPALPHGLCSCLPTVICNCCLSLQRMTVQKFLDGCAPSLL